MELLIHYLDRAMARHRTYCHERYRRIGHLRDRNHCPLSKRTMHETYSTNTFLFTVLVEGDSTKARGICSYSLSPSVRCTPSLETGTKLNCDSTILPFAIWAMRYITSLRSNRLEELSVLLSFQTSHVLLSTLLTEGWGSAFRIFEYVRQKRASKNQEDSQRTYSEGSRTSHSLFRSGRRESGNSMGVQKRDGQLEAEGIKLDSVHSFVPARQYSML